MTIRKRSNQARRTNRALRFGSEADRELRTEAEPHDPVDNVRSFAEPQICRAIVQYERGHDEQRQHHHRPFERAELTRVRQGRSRRNSLDGVDRVEP
jgi:hypothetical protein